MFSSPILAKQDKRKYMNYVTGLRTLSILQINSKRFGIFRKIKKLRSKNPIKKTLLLFHIKCHLSDLTPL